MGAKIEREGMQKEDRSTISTYTETDNQRNMDQCNIRKALDRRIPGHVYFLMKLPVPSSEGHFRGGEMVDDEHRL